MSGQTAKTKLRDRILLVMKNHISSDEMNVLEQVLTKELSGVNVEDITTLPAELRDSVDEQNRMIVEAFKYKKRTLKERTKENMERRKISQISLFSIFALILHKVLCNANPDLFHFFLILKGNRILIHTV